MSLTPLYSLRKFDNGEPAANVGVIVNQHADTLEAALAARGIPPADLQALIAAGWFSDTGWTDITPKPGFAILSAAEKPQVRRRGGLLLFQGGFSNTGMAASGTYLVANLPAPFRPAQNAIVGLGSSLGDAVASGFLTSGGDISIRASSTLGAYYKLDAFSGTLGA